MLSWDSRASPHHLQVHPHPAHLLCTPLIALWRKRDLQSPPGCVAVTATELKLLETSWGQKCHRLGTHQLVYSL